MNRRIRLLFVDDEADFVEYMTKRLEHQDLDVVAYLDPIEALEKTAGQSFDVALLDLKMPGIDGEELLRRLKDRDPLVEIIILTGHGSIESAFQTSRNGAYQYLLKPCDFDGLVASICNAYANRIKALHEHRAEQVDNILMRILKTSPLEALRQLKTVSDEIEQNLSASAMAEGGDFESAKKMRPKGKS
jgi:DNA-binding NtrC family response regulator